MNRTTGSPYAYDANGNMTNDGNNTLVRCRESPPQRHQRWRFSEYPTFDFQLSTFNLPARVFLRFLTPYVAVHECLTSPHAVQPSAEIPLRISYFRLSTVDF